MNHGLKHSAISFLRFSNFAFCFLFIASLSHAASAAELNDHTDFKKYSIYYNVMPSTFIPTDVAKIYGIKRSRYENLINVSISLTGEYGALPGSIKGTVTNLMQQQKPLEFIEIKEKTATYYIAPVRISGEELLHFELRVIPAGENNELNIKFSKKIYSDP